MAAPDAEAADLAEPALPGPACKHIVLLLLPATGRIVPLMVLAWKLALQGCRVSFVYFPPHRRVQVEDAFTTRAGKHPFITLVPLDISSDLEFAATNRLQDTIGSIGSMLNLAQDASFYAALEGLLDKLQPSCIISCEVMFTFRGSAKKNIPECVFFAMPATVLSLLFHVAGDIEKGKSPETISLDVPVLGPYPAQVGERNIVSILKSSKHSGFYSSFTRKLHHASAILVNSFPEAEPAAFEALKCPEVNPNQVPIVGIGPLLPDELFTSSSEHLASQLSKELDSFLSRQLPASVVYISFGSIELPATQQLHEIAKGLEASQKPFLWMVNSISYSELLPEGFVERTSHLGMVTSSWVPQLSVLLHPAIGAYLTHCGWNSSMEAISLGIPVITKPCMLDQYTNAWTLVEQLGMGVKLSKDGETFDCNDVEGAVRLLLDEDSEPGRSIRRRAKLVKAAANEAWKSSGKNLEALSEKLLLPRVS